MKRVLIVAVAAFCVGLGLRTDPPKSEVQASVLTGCTKQQATNVVNGVFSAEQVACLVLNAGLLDVLSPTTSAILESTCNISPALDQEVLKFINSFAMQKAAKEAAAKK